MTFEERYEEIARRLRTLQAAGDRVCGPPVRNENLDAAEHTLGLRLPEALRRLLVDFGPLISTNEFDIDNPSRLGKRLKRKIRCSARTYMLAPGTQTEDDLVRVVQALRQGSPALPPSLIPYRVTELHAGREVTFTYDCLDFDTLQDGEPSICKWTPWMNGNVFHPEADRTFLERLESEVSGWRGIGGRHARYEDLAARLRSEDCTDQYTFADPSDPEDIARTESVLGITLPEPYKRFLADFGPADLRNLLLDVRPEAEQSVLHVTEEQRSASPALPRGLIPFALGWTWIGPMRYEASYICFDYDRLLYGEPTITTWSPKSPREDQRQDDDQDFLDWLEERIRRTEEQPSPPGDWRNNAGWDRYWQRILKSKSERNWAAGHPGFILMREVDEMRKRGHRRILFAGNGISMEPHAFAHLGFDVTALDVSPAASRYVETFPITLKHLARFLPDFTTEWDEAFRRKVQTYDEVKSLQRVECEHVPGGNVTVVTADMFSYTPEETFDVVYSRRSFQAFSDEDRRTLAGRFHDWLRPGGFCIVETINLCMGGHHKEVEASFEGTGFLVRGRETNAWYEEATHPGLTFLKRDHHAKAELDRRRAEEHEREQQYLAGGGKVVVFAHGSG